MFRKVKPYFPPSNIFLLKALILSTIVISICQAQYAKAALVEIKIVDPVREVKLGETALFDAIITNKTSKSVKVTADFDPTNAVLGVLGSGSFISGMEISHNAQWQGSFLSVFPDPNKLGTVATVLSELTFSGSGLSSPITLRDNSVMVTVVPEPAEWLFLAVATPWLVWKLRKQIKTSSQPSMLFN